MTVSLNILDWLGVFFVEIKQFSHSAMLFEGKQRASGANSKIKIKSWLERKKIWHIRPGCHLLTESRLFAVLCTPIPHCLLISGLHINYETAHAEPSYSCGWKPKRIQHHSIKKGEKRGQKNCYGIKIIRCGELHRVWAWDAKTWHRWLTMRQYFRPTIKTNRQ